MSEDNRTAPVEYRTIPLHSGFRFGSDSSVQTVWTQGVNRRIGDRWKAVAPQLRPTGYSWIYLGPFATTKPFRLDEVLCEAFHGGRPPGTECLHRDGDRTNNLPANLFWGIAPENVRDPSVEYRRIAECEGYEFGSDGSTWSAWGTGNDRPGDVWRRMNPTVLSNGRLQVNVKWNGEMRRFGVHHLICIAFHGPCPDGMECCHDPDPDPANCRSGNLRWGTRRENAEDGIRHGTTSRGEDRWNASLTEVDVVEARRLYADGVTAVDLARRYDTSIPTMVAAISGVTWKHLAGAVAMRDSHSPRLSDEEIVRARQSYAAGTTTYELAAMLGVSVPTIVRAVSGKIGVDLPGAVPIRDSHARKLTDEQEAELCRLSREGWTLKALADRFGVSIPTARNVIGRNP